MKKLISLFSGMAKVVISRLRGIMTPEDVIGWVTAIVVFVLMTVGGAMLANHGHSVCQTWNSPAYVETSGWPILEMLAGTALLIPAIAAAAYAALFSAMGVLFIIVWPIRKLVDGLIWLKTLPFRSRQTAG